MQFCPEVHLEGRCDSCEVARMTRLTLAQVEDLYHQGRVNQVRYEAYTLLHSVLSPYTGVTEVSSGDPEVVKFARLLRAEHESRIKG